MKQALLRSIAAMLTLVAASDATALPTARPQAKIDPARAALIARTEAALLEQIRCRRTPQAARAINAMLKNRLIRYVDGESGVYAFAPIAPLRFLGLPVTYVGGFDYAGFKGTPDTKMLGPAPAPFLEIGVAASASQLRRKALDAGLVEAIPYQNKLGFEVSAPGDTSYLAGKGRPGTSAIMCADYMK